MVSWGHFKMQNIWTFSVEIAPLSIYLNVLIIHLFQYVIFISQNVILKWQFKICIHAVLNYVYGVLWRISGENWMLAATLLSASEKFSCVILITDLCASACVYMAFEVFLKYKRPGNNFFPHVWVDKWLFAALNKNKMFVSWISERNCCSWGKSLFSLSRVLQDLWDGEQSKTSFSWGHRNRIPGRFLSTACIR